MLLCHQPGGALAPYLFHEGTNVHTQSYLGCMIKPDSKGFTVVCRMYAPSADAVFLTGDFAGWGEGILLRRETAGGVFGAVFSLPDDPRGTYYKFRLHHGSRVELVADPFERAHELAGGGASVFGDAPAIRFHDRAFLRARDKITPADRAGTPELTALAADMERVGFGSAAQGGSYYAALCKTRGCSHVLFGSCRDPFSFAPPPRLGTPEAFAKLCDALHACGIGVLMPLCRPQMDGREAESAGTSYILYFHTVYHIDGFVAENPHDAAVLPYYRKLVAISGVNGASVLFLTPPCAQENAVACFPVSEGGGGFCGTVRTVPQWPVMKGVHPNMSNALPVFGQMPPPASLAVHLHHADLRDGTLLCGAVPCTGRVTFRFTISVGAAVTSAELLLQRDDDGRSFVFPMLWEDRTGDDERWFCVKEPAALCCAGSGLFYYRYRLHTPYGVRYCGRRHGTLTPILTEGETDSEPFRLTVYEKDFHTPDWLRGGVLYQIFPDRFARAGATDTHPEGTVIETDPTKPEARIHENWQDEIEQYGEQCGDFVRNDEFFGGSLRGIIEKLDYLASLGVTCLYLCPIFRSPSNHRYDTADYMHVDPLLGGDEAFSELADAACERGISVLLDGVFDHTGTDSLYFNANGTYKEEGAAQSQNSPYYPWFRFRKWPDDYECWWGVDTMPQIHTENEDFRRFICGENGVLRHWMRRGAAGFRLDVADELSPAFLEDVRCALKQEAGGAMLYGEVWEDASDKIAYDVRRRYFRGRQLDAVMNYPLRDAVLRFVKDGDAETLKNTAEVLYCHYPRAVSALQMNLIGSHDTERALTVLGGADTAGKGGTALRDLRLTEEQRKTGLARLRLASVLQFTLPGVPCIYYGDEAGMEGCRDPFCRRPFPWGSADETLLEHYRTLGRLRRTERALWSSEPEFLRAECGFVLYRRRSSHRSLLIAVNASDRRRRVRLEAGPVRDLLSGEPFDGRLEPLQAVVFAEA